MTSRLSKHLLKKALHCFLFSSLAFFLQPLTANAQPGIFSATGSMTTSRSDPMAVLLPNGKVLLTGGTSSTVLALASAELYDPATGTFSATGSMATGRFDGFTATLLPNGQVLVAGGNDGSITALASAELYDPTTGTFSATGSMTTGRYQHTATLLPSGKVLVAAGCYAANGNPCQTLASAELYDPATGTFSATGSLIAGRAGHTATPLPNGQVLVAGGVDFNSYVSLASAELYDPTTETFSATGSMITGRSGHSAALLPNGKVLVATGYNYSIASLLVSAELYDPTVGTFSATGSLTTGRIYQSAALLANGEFLVVGGSGNSGVLASAELYDPATGAFSATGSLITARATFNEATLLPNGQVLVAGGSGNSGPLASAELYTSTTTTKLVSSLNPSAYGQSVTLTATVTSGSGTPTGSVTFTDGASTLGTSSLSGGQATLATSALGAGGHSITATYGGAPGFIGSASSALAQTVNPASTALALASSVNPSAYSQSVTFTATITPQFGGQATGTVTFKDGATIIGSVAVSSNSASFATNALALGTHSITGSYSGDSNFTTSNSGAVSQVVHQATTGTVVASSLDPAYLTQSITFTATVTGQYGGLPTGSVTFKAGSTTLGAATLNSSGQASLTTSFSTAGCLLYTSTKKRTASAAYCAMASPNSS